MAKWAVLAVVACAAVCASAERMVVKERIPEARSVGWSFSGFAVESELLQLTIALKLNNLPKMHDTLMAVSDPDSPRYGRHLSKDQVDALTAPSYESVRTVLAWLESHGVMPEERLAHDSFITARVPVGKVEQMLATKYATFVNGEFTITRVLGDYSLPESVARHVDFVGPTTRFPMVQTLRRTLRTSDNLGVEPSNLRTQYGVGDTRASDPSNYQAAAGFLGQFYSPTDLASFFNQFYKPNVGDKCNQVGPNTDSNPGIEANLDVQYIMTMGAGVNTTFWSTPGQQPDNPENEPFLSWLMALASTPDAQLPKVFSISYGDNEPTVNYDYSVRVNAEFMKVGARGMSLLFASGDGGVSGGQPTDCSRFVPTWPAGSIYVTAVGGTDAAGTSAASLSAGGFSDRWDRPSYQKDAVAHYFSVAKNLPPSGDYNHTGAGVPDVAAAAEDFVITWNGLDTLVAGTSCAAPTFSGVLSLLNDARLKAGKAQLGYLNPLIYKNGDKFNDITSGSNPGCGTNGFEAAPGWDPITGFGTPNYPKLLKLVMSLQ